MYYLLLVLSTLTATGKAIFCKTVGRVEGGKRQTMLLNFQSFLIAFVCALLFTNKALAGVFTISPFSVTLSALFGLSVAFTQVTQVKAMSSGPASMVTLIYACGFLFPIVYGAFVWSEEISPFQIAGVCVLIISLVLIIGRKRRKRRAELYG